MKASSIRTADSLRRAWKRSGQPLDRFVRQLDRQGLHYLSHSKVACVERCPRCYYREYILGKRMKSEAMRVGTLFHRAAGQFYSAFQKGTIADPAVLLRRSSVRGVGEDSATRLRNALIVLRDQHWADHQVVSVETPFFMDLAKGLPPVIGIPDLVLKRQDSLVLVDHKTSRKFNDLDPAQLVLYAEHLRREHAHDRIVAVFDEYRLVKDLGTIRKPAFRRTPVSVGGSLVPPLIRRYREALDQMIAIQHDGEPSPSSDCWFCGRSGP